MAKVLRQVKANKGDEPVAWDDEAKRGDRYGEASSGKDGWNPAWGVGDTESVHPKGDAEKGAQSGRRKLPKKDKSRLKKTSSATGMGQFKDDEAPDSGISFNTKRKRTISNY